jgi:hypothetical protein
LGRGGFEVGVAQGCEFGCGEGVRIGVCEGEGGGRTDLGGGGDFKGTSWGGGWFEGLLLDLLGELGGGSVWVGVLVWV